MLTKAEFEREVCDAARADDGPKDMDSGYLFWLKLQKRRPDFTCRCGACRSNPWNHVRPLLRRCGFRD